MASFVEAAQSFIVSDIRIEGLEKIPDGTLLNYLPVIQGDPLDDKQVAFAIRELYKTGFFADVQLFRDGDVLVVRVKERPSISDIQFSGNSDIDDETLEDAMKGVGLQKGHIFNRTLLEKLTQELESVYYSQGKYNVKIDTEVEELDQNRVNILSSPHILASDNEAAKIDIGDEVPIVTSEYRTTDSTSTTTNVDKTIQYRDVGVLLSVTPHINDNGMVRMEVSQEVSELSNKTVEGVNSPVFSKRSANTKMSVRDGQTVVIAGLMQQTSSKAYSGVPWIGRLPLLRYFFGYEGHTFRNTELMIFITPHVILNSQDSEFINRSFLDRLEKIRAAER